MFYCNLTELVSNFQTDIRALWNFLSKYKENSSFSSSNQRYHVCHNSMGGEKITVHLER